MNPSIATTSIPSRKAFDCRASRDLNTALDRPFNHVQQSRWSCLIADRGEIDDHGHVLVTPSGVPPDMFVDADDAHVIEPGRIVDESPMSFGQDRVISGVPGYSELGRDDGDRGVIDNECFQSPCESGARDLGPGWGCLVGVMAPTRPRSAL